MNHVRIVLRRALEKRQGRHVWRLRSAVRGCAADVQVLDDRAPDRLVSLSTFRESKPGQERKSAVSAAITSWKRRPRPKAFSFATVTRVVRDVLATNSIHDKIAIVDAARIAHARPPLSDRQRRDLADDFETQRACGIVRRGDWRLMIAEWLKRPA